MDNPDSISAARAQAVKTLLAERDAAGHWAGELSTSALSTATAVCALHSVRAGLATQSRPDFPDANRLAHALDAGRQWLVNHANPDGGWGDTLRSNSNLSTTTLVWAALGATAPASAKEEVIARAERWIAERTGSLEPAKLAEAVIARYGKDRTFSVPILTLCALMGRLGPGREAWRAVIPLPFELAALPRSWFAALRLPVVSYALPALIAIGYARHYHAPSANPLARGLRRAVAPRTLALLNELQPENGGFLEATPLTSFVVLSLAGSGQLAHPVVRRGLEFLLASQRPDGSWPIDTNLATWLTTLSINALAPEDLREMPSAAVEKMRDWLLRQQYRVVHPYTQAAPGGWAWTDLPGGVPDADDTSGAVLALKNLGADPAAQAAAEQGIGWLLDVQNGDGGIPTFCRGWGTMPFDRSSADITAHAIRAWLAWRGELNGRGLARVEKALPRALHFLAVQQTPEGFWKPLWFGNQHRRDEANPVYGTARVLAALAEAVRVYPQAQPLLERGVAWLVQQQQAEGSWGGDAQCPASLEETALAVEALALCAGLVESLAPATRESTTSAMKRGARWLADQVLAGRIQTPAPIGFYFSNLWYYEKLYPLIFTVGALNACQAGCVLDASTSA